AAELARHQRQESDSDHGADPKPRRRLSAPSSGRAGFPSARLRREPPRTKLTRAPRLEPVRALAPTSLPWRRPRHEVLLLALVAVVALLPVYHVGDQELSRFCLTQAIVHGHLSNDRCLTPSFDKALYGGHFYSDKAPGLSFAAVPAAEVVQLRPVDEINGPDARLWAVRVLTSGIAF